MAGRDVCENSRRTLETIEFCIRNHKSGVIILIDFEKCFDRVEHKAVLGAMRHSGFSSTFTNWVGTFFNDFWLINHNGGHLSLPFAKVRGVNQGCPISPFCYLVMGELIAKEITLNKKIKGIELGNKIKNILAQFAHDTALYVHFDKISIDEIVKTFQNMWGRHRVINLIRENCHIPYWLHTKLEAKLYTQKNLYWTNEDTTLLGIDISTSDEGSARNYETVLNKMSDVCTQWSNRPLTLMGNVVSHQYFDGVIVSI